MRRLKAAELKFKEIPWIVSRSIAGFLNPEAVTFCRNLMSEGYEAGALVNVMPRHRLIYIAVPKAASTRIRRTLAKIEGRFSRSLKERRRTIYRGPYGPRNFPIGLFYQIATAPDVMRFSFVRNPYARAVLCWADKFAGKPLIGGDSFIDAYLSVRQQIDPRLPIGNDRTLSFSQFTVFTAATSQIRHDIHMQTQDGILGMPGIKLDLIGKVENFNTDFVRILDYLNAARTSAAKRPLRSMNRIMMTGRPITRLNWPTAFIAPRKPISTVSATFARSATRLRPGGQRQKEPPWSATPLLFVHKPLTGGTGSFA
ncbi:MAG TPA: sulfotransferase family 2 domain-containing protein [Pseudolabrys sp.]